MKSLIPDTSQDCSLIVKLNHRIIRRSRITVSPKLNPYSNRLK